MLDVLLANALLVALHVLLACTRCAGLNESSCGHDLEQGVELFGMMLHSIPTLPSCVLDSTI